MKLVEALSGFDSYGRHARIYPGLIVVFPVMLLSAAFAQIGKPMAALVPVLLSAASLLLLANVVRRLGRRIEGRLASDWDGMPTTKMLRFREPQNSAMFERRRRAIEEIYGSSLPSRRQESANPQKADEAYVAATRRLIVLLRSRPEQSKLLDHENANYGFARNILGAKPLGLLVLGAAAACDCAIYFRMGFSTSLAAVAVLHLLLAGFWLFFVRPAWVRQAGEIYAERLFECLEIFHTDQAGEQSGSSGQGAG
jgi:hypothetical protein